MRTESKWEITQTRVTEGSNYHPYKEGVKEKKFAEKRIAEQSHQGATGKVLWPCWNV